MAIRASRSTFVTVAALLTLVGCLTFTAVRLFQADNSLRQVYSHSNLWWLTQSQAEALLFSETLALVAAGAVAPDDPLVMRRFNILMSRIDLLLDGPQRRQMDSIGGVTSVAGIHKLLVSAEPAVQAGLDRDAALRLQGEVGRFGRDLRQAANNYILVYRNESFAARDLYLRVVLEATAAVFGIVLSGSVLLFRFFVGFRRTRRAERLLRQEQAFSDLVVALSNQGIVILDEHRNCLLWNPGMEALFGVGGKDAVGRRVQASVPLFASASVLAAFESAARGASCTLELESEPGEEPRRCLEVSCHPLDMAERRLVIAFVRNVTERWEARQRAERHSVHLESEVKQRTQALQQAEERLVAAIKTASDGFAAFDNEGRLLIANERIRSTEPVASCYREDMTLSSFLACFAVCEGADHRLLDPGRVFRGTVDLDLRLGADNWAHLAVTQAEGGTVFVRLTDVTPYKRAAIALQSALDREREITAAYRSFVSMVSHQFRTPLAIVDSSAQRILRRGVEATSDEIAMRMRKIRNATIRLTQLVESVLNAAKIDSGQIELRPAVCDMVDLVSEVCDRQRDISPTFEIRFERPAQPIELVCDATLLEQVLVNLLSNAVKYSGSATLIEVHLWSDEHAVRCSVRDHGIGIPPDELPKVFDRFYRARTASGIAGTGIGLNVAREIVQMHGGTIDVVSSEGSGSEFILTMPVRAASAVPAAA